MAQVEKKWKKLAQLKKCRENKNKFKNRVGASFRHDTTDYFDSNYKKILTTRILCCAILQPCISRSK